MEREDVSVGVDLYKLLFVAGDVTIEGDVYRNSELPRTVFVSLTAPGLFIFTLCVAPGSCCFLVR